MVLNFKNVLLNHISSKAQTFEHAKRELTLLFELAYFILETPKGYTQKVQTQIRYTVKLCRGTDSSDFFERLYFVTFYKNLYFFMMKF